MADEQVDVVVVGAGCAGLTAATMLHEAGLSVVVFEARDRVGGRTCTEEHHGTWIDMGGQWVGPGQDRVTKLAAKLGVDLFPQHAVGDDVVMRGDAVHRVEDLTLAFDDEVFDGYLRLMTDLETISSHVPLDAPWTAPQADMLDATTLASWVREQNAGQEAKALFETCMQAVFAASTAEMSLLHAAFYVASAGGIVQLIQIEGGAQQDRLVGGAQGLAEALARLLPATALHLSAPVRRIVQGRDGVVVGAPDAAVEAERVVVALPPTLAGRIDYEPALPGRRDQLVQRMPQGSVIKFHVFYETPWWRDDGMSGIVLCSDGPVRVMFDGTPPDGAPGIMTGFFEPEAAVAAGALSPDERSRVVVDILVRSLGAEAREPMGYVDRDWSAEPFTRGCYGAHLPPGAWTVYGPALRSPVGRIHWAGTETAERWAGYIDGAIESGERAAAEILAS